MAEYILAVQPSNNDQGQIGNPPISFDLVIALAFGVVGVVVLTFIRANRQQAPKPKP